MSTTQKPNQTGSLTELKCPLCRKPLASEEYNDAINELRKRESVSYEGKLKEVSGEFERKLLKANEEHTIELERIKKGGTAQMQLLEENLKVTYQQQIEILKKNYEQINQDSRQHFDLMSKQNIEANAKALEEKEKKIKELNDAQTRFKALAIEEATARSKGEIDALQLQVRERDVQLKRFEQDIEGLKRQVNQSQSELKGEAGELDLYEKLVTAFNKDHIIRQKRGTSTGDVIQKIRTSYGELKTPIIYDNKESAGVTKQDMEKAKSYKKIHNTNYVIIVSRNLPKKEIENGLLGEKEGVLICHPSIVVELATQLRTALIEIEKHAEGRENRTTKESRLFDYIVSQEFHQNILELARIHSFLASLQIKEEKQHQTIWKERKKTVERLVGTATAIESDIESIVGSNKMISKKVAASQEALT